MSDAKLGLIGAMSISVGGMIGGGVYAVLGVVVLQAGAASWLAFTGRSTLAGMIGWTLLFGYVGAMAMYAFAFGGFTVELLHSAALLRTESALGIQLQSLISVTAIGLFVALVVAGTKVTGWVETALATTKP